MAAVPDEVLDARARNRALLARQLLLERTPLAPRDAIEHLVGLQAQAPNAPYVALWSRLEPFDPTATGALLERRETVRTHVMRSTVHLVTVGDGAALRPLLQPMLERAFGSSPWRRRLGDVDLGAVARAGRELLGGGALTRAQLAPLLIERFPGHDGAALAHAVTVLVPAVQVPPRGVWGATGPAAGAETVAWTGRALAGESSADAVVLRYLAAFGPASIPDVRTWSGLGGIRAIVDRLRPSLQTFRDTAGRELLDVPDAPRPDPGVPAPPRFLPEFDNVLLSHDDRSHINPGRHPVPLRSGNGGVAGTVLVDGLFRGLWSLQREGGGALVRVEALDRFSRAERAAVVAEGGRLAAFAAPDAARHGASVA